MLVITLSEGAAVHRKRAEEKDTLIFCEHDWLRIKPLRRTSYVWTPRSHTADKTAAFPSFQFLVMRTRPCGETLILVFQQDCLREDDERDEDDSGISTSSDVCGVSFNRK